MILYRFTVYVFHKYFERYKRAKKANLHNVVL